MNKEQLEQIINHLKEYRKGIDSLIGNRGVRMLVGADYTELQRRRELVTRCIDLVQSEINIVTVTDGD